MLVPLSILASTLVLGSQLPINIPHRPDHRTYPSPGDKLPVNVTILLPQEVRAWTAPAYYASQVLYSVRRADTYISVRLIAPGRSSRNGIVDLLAMLSLDL